ncbi:TonB-dependent receptor [Sphingobium sp. SA916]|uniref:TonB-dependent receptor n=1 Tax=Sphingobium sp. SA916 TaxID=1851207 RepID=UPI000C9F4E35|nr:TonB-dependent receptor [Sphingobium sp. SA916]PNP97979.1 hypothetical protein A8G00_21175 [Sphingobium sp. SA916]
MKIGKAFLLGATALSAAFICLPAIAAEAEVDTQESEANNTGIQDIVVTAQRRGENLQKVPIAVTAFSGEALETRGLTDPQSLEGAVPSLTMSRQATSNFPYLRGIGSQAGAGVDEASVATYIDGFYIASNLSNQYGFNNLERIEVLKGPQGTLFGRNATGGVIQLITKEPSQEFKGNFNAGYGNYQTVDFDGYITGGITPELAADLAVQYHDQNEGFGRNLVTGNDVYKQWDYAIRSKWVYSGDSTKLTFFINHEKLQSNGLLNRLTPESLAAKGLTEIGRFNFASYKDPWQRSRKVYLGFRVEQDLGFANLISSTFYANNNQIYASTTDTQQSTIVYRPTDATDSARDKSKQFSQEFQLLGNAESRLQWQMGAYVFRFKSDTILSLQDPFRAPNPIVFGSAKTSSFALYGQATYEIVPDVKLTGGFRYSWDEYKTFDSRTSIPSLGLDIAAPDRKANFGKPTWRLGIDYQMTPDILGYISYNRGVKSGGFSIYAQTAPGYAPEVLDAYEAGLKTQLFQRAVRFNIAGFYYDYKNLQVQVILPGGAASQILNAATARVYGLDADFEVVPFENFTISGGFGILDAKYIDFPGAPVVGADGVRTIINAGGNRMVNAPKFSGSISATYVVPTQIGEFRVNGSVSHKGLSWATPGNILPFNAYTLLNATIGWTSSDGRFGVDLWGRNLTDKVYYGFRIESPFGHSQMDAPPRTYGVRLKAKF